MDRLRPAAFKSDRVHHRPPRPPLAPLRAGQRHRKRNRLAGQQAVNPQLALQDAVAKVEGDKPVGVLRAACTRCAR
jgi:hypothetical protein